MSDTSQQAHSIAIWTKISKHLHDEIDEVVYGPWLEPLTFVESRDGVVRLSLPSAFRRDWVDNTYQEYMLGLWQKEDDGITDLEIIVQPRSADRSAHEGHQKKPRATSVKSPPVVVSAVDRAPIERVQIPVERDPVRARIGKIGVWSRSPYFYEAAQATNLAQAAEELGYGSLWIPGFDGGHIFERCELALKATKRLTIATGIINIWRHEPAEVAKTVIRLRADSGDRFMVGMGGSHKFLIGDEYDKISPLKKMRYYLDDLDAAGLPQEGRLLGALGPKMQALSAQRTVGCHPCFIPPEAATAARKALGEEALLMPEVTVIMETDADKARAYARKFAGLYFKGPNYANMLKRFGFTDEDFAGEGSDRLIDAIYAWGDAEKIAARVKSYLDAGADHVAIQSRGTKPEVEVWSELAPLLLD